MRFILTKGEIMLNVNPSKLSIQCKTSCAKFAQQKLERLNLVSEKVLKNVPETIKPLKNATSQKLAEQKSARLFKNV